MTRSRSGGGGHSISIQGDANHLPGEVGDPVMRGENPLPFSTDRSCITFVCRQGNPFAVIRVVTGICRKQARRRLSRRDGTAYAEIQCHLSTIHVPVRRSLPMSKGLVHRTLVRSRAWATGRLRRRARFTRNTQSRPIRGPREDPVDRYRTKYEVAGGLRLPGSTGQAFSDCPRGIGHRRGLDPAGILATPSEGPFEGKYRNASVVHDVECEQGERAVAGRSQDVL